MRKIKTIASLCLFIVIASCQPASIEENNIINQNLNLQNTNTEEESNQTHLERNLQWVSFITAKVLTESEEARNEFEYLAGATNSIFLSDLIGENSDALTFQGGFEDQASIYVVYNVHRERERPPHPIGSKDLPSEIMSPGDLDEFFNLILDENCIEIYMPEGYLFEGNFTATSSAHPLTNAEENYGYKRYYSENDEEYSTSQIILNDDYLTDNINNIFIARPFIDIENGCLYEEFSEINFLEFMGN